MIIDPLVDFQFVVSRIRFEVQNRPLGRNVTPLYIIDKSVGLKFGEWIG